MFNSRSNSSDSGFPYPEEAKIRVTGSVSNRYLHIDLPQEQMYAFDIHYTVDGSQPTPESAKYTRPVKISPDVACIKVCFAKGGSLSSVLTQELNKSGAKQSSTHSPKTDSFSCSSCGNSVTPNNGLAKCSRCGTSFRYNSDSQLYKPDRGSISVPPDSKPDRVKPHESPISVPSDRKPEIVSKPQPSAPSVTPTPTPSYERKPEIVEKPAPSTSSSSYSSSSTYSASSASSSSGFMDFLEDCMDFLQNWVMPIVLLFVFVLAVWQIYIEYVGFWLYKGAAYITGSADGMVEVGHLYDGGYKYSPFSFSGYRYGVKNYKLEDELDLRNEKDVVGIDESHTFDADMDHEKALQWYQKAAKAGSWDGMFHMGVHYYHEYRAKLQEELHAFSLKEAIRTPMTPYREKVLGEAKYYLYQAEIMFREAIKKGKWESWRYSDRIKDHGRIIYHKSCAYLARCMIEQNEEAYEKEIADCCSAIMGEESPDKDLLHYSYKLDAWFSAYQKRKEAREKARWRK